MRRSYTPQTGFALLLIAAGLVLTLVPEFVYLRDNFGTRMNTVFKFYYQAWLCSASAALTACISFFAGQRQPRSGWRVGLRRVGGGRAGRWGCCSR